MCEKPKHDVLELFSKNHLVKACAPMVRYSKLQFRNLVKQYDCDLVFTPMILADSFCKSDKARSNEFTTNFLDTPLVAQFAANTVHDFVGASYLVAPFCDGVDLNCGCPQRWAREMNLGCELVKTPQKIFELVRECRNRIPKPFTISVKTRIQKNDKDTVELCRGLEKCDLSFLTIHARTPDNNVGPINEDSLRLAADCVQIPIIGNGGASSLKQCLELQEKTGVGGVMIANGILSNPEVFMGANATSLHCVQEWLNICYNSTLTMEAHEQIVEERNGAYGTIPERPHNLTFQCFHHHLVFMLEKILTRKQRRVFNNLKTFYSVLEFIELNFKLRPQLFTQERFLKAAPLSLECDERIDFYHGLRPVVEPERRSDFIEYDYDRTQGAYFREKCSEENDRCDWSSMFFEND